MNKQEDNIPYRVYWFMVMANSSSEIGKWLKQKRREAGLSQQEFADMAGLGLRFVRDLEQGKPTVRMDKVNQALWMFGAQTGVVPLHSEDTYGNKQ